MKRILITGVNSYIGSNVKRYLQEYNASQGKECFQIEELSQREESWEQHDFSVYDTILDVTGKAHADIGQVTEAQKQQYYRVNCELAEKTARKAKNEGVKQFIYLSSIIVYGDSALVGNKKHITKETLPAPSNFYGDSKWQAEQRIIPLESEKFKVAVLRLPFVYGYKSKGNYPLLARLAKKTPVFPTINNERSMLYIENLCECIRLLVESEKGGVYFPQNKEYSSTPEMVQCIAKEHNKKIYMCALLNWAVKIMAKCPGKVGRLTNKAFGCLTYDKSMSVEPGSYQLFGLEESIRQIERKE